MQTRDLITAEEQATAGLDHVTRHGNIHVTTLRVTRTHFTRIRRCRITLRTCLTTRCIGMLPAILSPRRRMHTWPRTNRCIRFGSSTLSVTGVTTTPGSISSGASRLGELPLSKIIIICRREMGWDFRSKKWVFGAKKMT